MSSDLLTRFERTSDIVTRSVAGEVILVPIVKRIGEQACLYTLDEIAAFLWEKLEKPAAGGDLVQALKAAYQVEESQAENDVRQFLEQLETMAAIRALTPQ